MIINTRPTVAILLAPTGPQTFAAVRRVGTRGLGVPTAMLIAGESPEEGALRGGREDGWDVRVPPMSLNPVLDHWVDEETLVRVFVSDALAWQVRPELPDVQPYEAGLAELSATAFVRRHREVLADLQHSCWIAHQGMVRQALA